MARRYIDDIDETGDSLVLPLPLLQAGGGIPGHEAQLSHRVHHSNNARRRSIPEGPMLRIPTKDFGCLNCQQCDRNQSESDPNRSNPPMSSPSVSHRKETCMWCDALRSLFVFDNHAPTEPKRHDSGQPTHLSSCGQLRWQFLCWCSECFHHGWPVLGGPWELQCMYVTLG